MLNLTLHDAQKILVTEDCVAGPPAVFRSLAQPGPKPIRRSYTSGTGAPGYTQWPIYIYIHQRKKFRCQMHGLLNTYFLHSVMASGNQSETDP